MKLLRGIGVALVTPFNENLSIDYNGLEKLVEFNISNGINYLVVMGTTAESATLSKQEKKEVLACVIKVTNNRIPVVLGIGGNNTMQVVDDLQNTDLTGVSAILSVSPAYNKPTQEGIYQHFSAVAKASSLPIVLYNVPGRTSSNISPSTVARLANDFENIVAIKEAVGDIAQVLELLRDVPDGFVVLSGDDTLAPSLISAGGKGVISVIGQALPVQYGSIIQNALAGENQKAYKEHFKTLEIIDLIFEEGNPAGIKALLSQLDVCKPFVRLPLVKASQELQDKLADSLKDFN